MFTAQVLSSACSISLCGPGPLAQLAQFA